MAQHHLDMPAQGKEKDKHDNRVEPDFTLAAEKVKATGNKSQADGERHRHIHSGAAGADAAPGAGEKDSSGIEQDRERDHQADPLQETALSDCYSVGVSGIQSHGVHHHLHHAKSGYTEAFHGITPLFLPSLLFGAGQRQVRLVAQLHQRFSEATEAVPLRAPDNSRVAGCRVHLNRLHTGFVFHVAANQPGAGRASNAFSL